MAIQPPSPSLESAPLSEGDRPASLWLRLRVVFGIIRARLAQWLVARRWARESRWRVLGAAEAALYRGNGGKARRLLDSYLARHPDDVDAWVLLGVSHGHDAQAVISDLSRAHTLARRTPVLAMMISLAHARLGEKEEAMDWAGCADADPAVQKQLRSQPEIQQLLVSLG